MKKCSILVLILAISMGGIVAKPAPAPLLGGISDIVGVVLKAVTDLAKNLLNNVSSTLNTVVSKTLKIVGELQSLSNGLSSVPVSVDLSAFAKDLMVLQDSVSKIESELYLPDAKATASFISALLNRIINVLKSFQTLAVPPLEPITGTNISNITGLLKTLNSTISQVANKAPNTALIKSIGDTAVYALTDAIQQITSVVTRVATNLIDVVFQAIKTLILNLVGKLLADFLAKVQDAVASLNALGQTLTPELMARLAELQNTATTSLGLLVRQLPLTDTEQQIQPTLDELKAKVGDLVQTILTLVYGLLATLSSLLSSLGANAATQILDKVTAILDELTSQLSADPTAILSCLSDLPNAVLSIILNVVGELLSCISEFVSVIEAIVLGIPSAINTFITDLDAEFSKCLDPTLIDPTDPTGIVTCLTDAAETQFTILNAALYGIIGQLSDSATAAQNLTSCVKKQVDNVQTDLQDLVGGLIACAGV